MVPKDAPLGSWEDIQFINQSNTSQKSNASSSSKMRAATAMGVGLLLAMGGIALFGVAGGFGTHDPTLRLLILSAIVIGVGVFALRSGAITWSMLNRTKPR